VSAPSSADLRFPPSTQPATRLSEALRQQGFGCRAAEARDMTFMRGLYEALRAEELASIAWPAGTREAFLDSQFALQHHHFITHFEQAEFLLLEHDGIAMGRLYVLRSATRWLIIDIGLLPAWQGRGVGGALLRQLQQDALNADAQGLSLHVRLDNPRAHTLYLKLGFRNESVDGTHLLMHWDASVADAQLNTA
jgi:ribosomal protein S18 acetylase RimI-like enzyme